jgi:Domain of unknown function (DUF3291)
MYVTITSLKLKSLWGFFRLSLNGLKISNQANREKGFVSIKSSGFGYLHYTITLWQTEGDLKRFAYSGAHKEAMKQSASLAQEIRTFTFAANELPNWKEAKKLLMEKGKVLTFKKADL